jgi:hypothetical protein
LAVQHLLGEVVEDVSVAAREVGDESGDVVVSAQRETGQLQAGGPALRAFPERRDDVVRQLAADRRAQQFGGFVRGEAQVPGTELAELTPSPQPRQRRLRLATTRRSADGTW